MLLVDMQIFELWSAGGRERREAGTCKQHQRARTSTTLPYPELLRARTVRGLGQP